MKRLIILILLSFGAKAYGQVYQLMPQYGYDAKRMKFDSTLQIPTVCGEPTLKSNVIKYAAIAYDSCNKRLYYYDPKLAVWDTIKGGSGGPPTDTTSLSNRINSKLNISDTSAMLSPYLKAVDTASLSDRINAIPIIDTTSLSNRIDLKLNISDTSTMLSPYARANDIDLQFVTDNGGITTNDILAQRFGIYDLFYNNYGLIYLNQEIFYINDSAENVLNFQRGRLGLTKSSGISADLDALSLTTMRTFTFPDTSGTFILNTDTSAMLMPYLYAADTLSLSNRIDAAGGGGSDSPDRINGIATTDVVADMNQYNMTFKNVDTFYIRANAFDSAYMLSIDASNYRVYLGDNNVPSFGSFQVGGTGSEAGAEFIITNPILVTANISDVQIESNVQSSYVKTDVDLLEADYFADWVGLYIVFQSDPDNYSFYLPNPLKFKGLSIQIINADGGANVELQTPSGTINGPTAIEPLKMAILYSDGENWHGFSTNRE